MVTILLDGVTTLASATNAPASHVGGATSLFDGTIDFAGTGGFTSSTVTTTGTGAGGALTPGLYAIFGPGSFPVSIQRSASQAALAAPGGFVLTNNDAVSRVNYSVTYTYNVIPEPAPISFVGLAASLLLVRRRRN